MDYAVIHWVDRRDGEIFQAEAKLIGTSKEDAFDNIVLDLLHGKSVKTWIEATWNQKENRSFLPTRAGIAKAAQITGAYIFPIYVDYNFYKGNKCSIYPGMPFLVDLEDDHIEANEYIGEQMNTIAHSIMSYNNQQRRVLGKKPITTAEARKEFYKYLEKTLKEFKALDPDYEKEFIFQNRDKNGNPVVNATEVNGLFYPFLPKESTYTLKKRKKNKKVV